MQVTTIVNHRNIDELDELFTVMDSLDIERRPETIQGNIRRDRLADVWRERFSFFRKNLSDMSETCRDCGHSRFCRGDAHHSWNHDENRPMVCMKGTLFE